jgi:hypothetical protein
MKKCVFVLSLLLMPSLAAAQTGQGTGAGSASAGNDQATTQSQSTTKDGKTTTTTTRVDESQSNSRFVRTLTNVQIELTLTDQIGNNVPEKKTVSMVVSSGNWGKIRTSAARTEPIRVGLNVDARPFVATDGPIQLELTIYYYPPQGEPKSPGMPTELNQSLTVVLQSGKPMLISQAADPASDRKITVEAKATVLK